MNHNLKERKEHKRRLLFSSLRSSRFKNYLGPQRNTPNNCTHPIGIWMDVSVFKNLKNTTYRAPIDSSCALYNLYLVFLHKIV